MKRHDDSQRSDRLAVTTGGPGGPVAPESLTGVPRSRESALFGVRVDEDEVL